MVNFVGAGCGAADLITLRGARLLNRADVVIYAGSLVNPELLTYAPESCEIYNSAEMTLDEVIAVMEEAERTGKRTVRLHTGDPSLYGAIREQMDRLDALHIPYEICPGVSSFCGAAAALRFLSTGMLPALSRQLIEGGYSPETPAAIVYKASWQDEKICRCTVATLAATAEENGIRKTALICVGRFLGDSYSLSRLYDRTFETEFRRAKP